MKLNLKKPISTKKQGVAIVIVLSVLTLMAAMVLSIFTMGKTEAIASKADAEMFHSRLLADTAVNLVIGQLREATSQQKGSIPSPWTTQPGAATVHQLDGSIDTIFKLYSAAQLTARSSAELKSDVPENWRSLPGHFVDLNAPQSLAPLKFPIVDPRAASIDPKESTEGFSYDEAPGVVKPQTTADEQRLPMPVRWLYQLKDGTLGILSAEGKFMGSSQATASNPIVGRIAYWTDDESCKINVNTSSEGVYWDSPRVTSEEDRDLANYQPCRGEFQHYPGHPAQVSLSSVLFPHQRLQSSNAVAAKSSSSMKELSIEDARGLWLIAPGIGSDPTITTDGGRKKAAHIADPSYEPPLSIATPEQYHLYSHPDEILWTPERKKQLLFERQPAAQTRLERSSFFLTAKSQAPETTLFGTPRICIWPVHGQTDSESDPSHVLAETARSTQFDSYMAFTNTLGGRKYYVQRRDAKNGWWDFFKCNGGENQLLLNYLTKLTDNAFPGFQTQDGNATFAKKYGSGTGSDREQIFVSILDYIRMINLNDANLPWNNQFSIICPGNPDQGYGQITPLSTVGGANYKASGALTEQQKHSAKGIGRMLTVSEVVFVFSCRAQVGPDGKIQGSPSPANRAKLKTPGDRELEVGVVVEGFVPAQGWTEYRPYCSMAIGGSTANGANELSDSIPEMMLAGQKMELPASRALRSTTSGDGPPQRWLAWGGSAGYRCFTSNVLSFKPLVVPSTQSTLNFTGTAGKASMLQLVLYDDPSSAGGSGTTGNADIAQVIPLALPPFQELPVPMLPSAGKAYSLADRFTAAVAGEEFLTSSDVAQSLVPNHGDFRLLAASRQASAPSFAHSPNAGRPVFVPHPAWGTTKQAHSLQEPVQPSSTASKNGYFPNIAVPQNSPDFTIAPYDSSKTGLLPKGNQFEPATMEAIFQAGRLDGGARGPCFPNVTGDFDNGIARAPDGPYINRPDDGDITGYAKGNAYFDVVSTNPAALPKPSKSAFSPNRLLGSPGMFGSLPTGVRAGVPWQTLLFRPWSQANPEAWNPSMDHYGFKTPRDHLLLDLFWMPVIEPYGISVPFATAGKINLNQSIAPFQYIHRTTALHALFKAEKLLAIPNSAAAEYKDPAKFSNATWRHFIDATETLKLWEMDRGGSDRPYISASEICEHYLVPEGQKGDRSAMDAFWKDHQLTGDNSKERPYTNLLSRLTTRSNVFKVFFKCQSIQKARSSAPDKFDPAKDKVTAEFAGDAIIERTLDPTRPDLPDYAGEIAAGTTPRPLDDFYHWRITQFHQTHN